MKKEQLKSMNNQIALASLAMDLKRVALGYHRNSIKMGKRFYEEAKKRKNEIDQTQLKPYIKNILSKMDTLLQQDNQTIAENALMFSTLLQNYSQSSLQ